MNFTDRLNEVMESKGWKQVDLCKNADISSAQATHLMNGRTKDPMIGTVAKIANALDVSIDYLCGRTDNPGGLTAEELENLKLETDVKSLIRIFRKLPPSGRAAIIDQANYQLSKSTCMHGNTISEEGVAEDLSA